MDCEGLLGLSYILSGAGGKGVWRHAAILQERLPVAPWMAEHTLRLPGTVPIAPADWLQRDEVFAEQMAYRDRLIAERPAAVHAMAEGCRPAAEELLALVLAHLDGVPGYRARGRRRCAGRTASRCRSTARRWSRPGGWCRRISACSRSPRAATSTC